MTCLCYHLTNFAVLLDVYDNAVGISVTYTPLSLRLVLEARTRAYIRDDGPHHSFCTHLKLQDLNQPSSTYVVCSVNRTSWMKEIARPCPTFPTSEDHSPFCPALSSLLFSSTSGTYRTPEVRFLLVCIFSVREAHCAYKWMIRPNTHSVINGYNAYKCYKKFNVINSSVSVLDVLCVCAQAA